MVTVSATVLDKPVDEFDLSDSAFEIFIEWVPFIVLLSKEKPITFTFMYTNNQRSTA